MKHLAKALWKLHSMISWYKSSLSFISCIYQLCILRSPICFSFTVSVINPSLWIVIEGPDFLSSVTLSKSNTVFSFIGSLSISATMNIFYLFIFLFLFFFCFAPVLFHYSQIPEFITEIIHIQLTTLFHLLSLHFLVAMIITKNTQISNWSESLLR